MGEDREKNIYFSGGWKASEVSMCHYLEDFQKIPKSGILHYIFDSRLELREMKDRVRGRSFLYFVTLKFKDRDNQGKVDQIEELIVLGLNTKSVKIRNIKTVEFERRKRLLLSYL